MSFGLRHWFLKLKIQNIHRTPVGAVLTTYLGRRALSCSSVALALAKCEGLGESELLKPENLTHEQCIKQACLVSVNAASTLLTTTASALLDICSNYKDALNKILSLLEEVQAFDGSDNPVLWDAIVEARAQVNKAKSAVSELNSYMESVEKVVTSTTEAAFLAGAEYMCTTLCERLDSVQREIRYQFGDLKKLEEEYLKVQQAIVSDKHKDVDKNKSNKKKVEVKKDGGLLDVLGR